MISEALIPGKYSTRARFGKIIQKSLKFLKDFIFFRVYIDTVETLNTSKEKINMSKIFKWFADASANWDHTSQNDAGAVLGFIASIFEALGA